MHYQPHQPPPRPRRFVDRKGFRFGCLPAMVIGWVIFLLAIFSSGDNNNDKPGKAKKPAATTAASADHGKLDDAASLACYDFAYGYKAAQTQSARIDLANKVNKWAQQSRTEGIADNATVLARGSEGSPGAWQIGADMFAQTCLDAGWKG
ncbi:hypothetical protein [Streptomyces sp. NBRC 110035]|uniref:hypothetical protein n=1 Tax=Streptomyces sp. NBRC 110035 TaxID=1547867 RepID=UPI0005A7440F|nr:hypothetical protein [Streptomyces sp. NBRC 110035]